MPASYVAQAKDPPNVVPKPPHPTVEHVEEADNPDAPPLPPEKSDAEPTPFNISPHLSPDQADTLQALLDEYEDCFSDGATLGKVRDYTADIPITPGARLPPPQQLRPANPAKRAVIEKAIQDYLDMDVIEPCRSPTAAAIVIVKQNGKSRF
ncbi:hypothetical protein BJ508DRAFT_213670, partial [Ascobolus immersus RN42]